MTTTTNTSATFPRRRVLFWFYSMFHLSLLCGPPIVAALMTRHVYLPFMVVGVIIVVRYALLLVIPETLVLVVPRLDSNDTATPSRSVAREQEASQIVTPETSIRPDVQTSTSNQIVTTARASMTSKGTRFEVSTPPSSRLECEASNT